MHPQVSWSAYTNFQFSPNLTLKTISFVDCQRGKWLRWTSDHQNSACMVKFIFIESSGRERNISLPTIGLFLRKNVWICHDLNCSILLSHLFVGHPSTCHSILTRKIYTPGILARLAYLVVDSTNNGHTTC